MTGSSLCPAWAAARRRKSGGGLSAGDTGADRHTPRAERRRFRRFVVTMLVWILTHIPHGAAGLAKARHSARPCALGVPDAQRKKRYGLMEYGRARAGQRTGPAELCLPVPREGEDLKAKRRSEMGAS